MKALPYPARKVFARRVFQAFDVIEVVVIQKVEKGLEGCFQVGKVHDPTRMRMKRAAHMYLDAERMAVQPGALMAGRYVGQAMRRLNGKDFVNLHTVTLPPPRP